MKVYWYTKQIMVYYKGKYMLTQQNIHIEQLVIDSSLCEGKMIYWSIAKVNLVSRIISYSFLSYCVRLLSSRFFIPISQPNSTMLSRYLIQLVNHWFKYRYLPRKFGLWSPSLGQHILGNPVSGSFPHRYTWKEI